MFLRLGPPFSRQLEDADLVAERDWWLRFEPHAKPWITAAVESGEILSPMESWHGAYIVLAAVRDHFGEQNDWTTMTGHELLFENLGHGGLLEGWSCRAVVLGMRSFMAYLTAHEVVEAASGQHLIAEINAWEARIVAYFEGDGPWCAPNA